MRGSSSHQQIVSSTAPRSLQRRRPSPEPRAEELELPHDDRAEVSVLGAIIISTLTVGLNVTKVGPNWQVMITGFILIIAVYFTMDRSKSVIVK